MSRGDRERHEAEPNDRYDDLPARLSAQQSVAIAETAALLSPPDSAPASVIGADPSSGIEAVESANSRWEEALGLTEPEAEPLLIYQSGGPPRPIGADLDSGDGGSDRGGLGRKASRGAAVTATGQLAKLSVQTGGVFLLARFLTPNDYGLTTMVAAIIGVADIVRDFGLSAATVQAKVLSRQQRDNLWWINTSIGGALTILTIACSGLIARVYGDHRLQAVAMVMSLTFLIDGMGAQYEANLQRSLKFLFLTLSDIIGITAGLATALTMAILNFGYWSIVAQQVVQSLATLAVVVVASRWLPGRFRRGVPMRGFLKFGLDIFLAQTVSYLCRNTDSVTIGIRFGAGPLGLYNKAFQLLTLPLTQLNAPATRVAYPVLARLQDKKKRYEEFLITGQTALLHLVLTVLASMCALAEPMIHFVLGPRWVGSASLFQILAIAGAMQSAGYVTYWVFLSKGLTRTSLKQILVTRPATILTVIVGSYWGVHGVAWGFAAGTALSWPISLWWISRVSDAPVRRLTWNGIRCLFGYGLGGLAAFAASQTLRDQFDIVRLVSGFAAMLVVLGVEYLVWPAFRRDVGLIRNALRLVRSKPGAIRKDRRRGSRNAASGRHSER